MPTTTQVITLKPGETLSLPPDAEVIYISSASVETTCPLPDFEDYACYRLFWALNDDQGSSPALEHQESKLASIKILGVEYPLDLDPYAIYTDNGNSETAVAAAFTAKLPPGIIIVDHVESNFSAARGAQTVYIKTFPSVAADMLLYITGPGFDDGLYIKPTSSDNCDFGN